MNISHENVDAINAVVNVALAPEDYNPQVDKEIKAQAKKSKITRVPSRSSSSGTYQTYLW
jgi:hypothetical protein